MLRYCSDVRTLFEIRCGILREILAILDITVSVFQSGTAILQLDGHNSDSVHVGHVVWAVCGPAIWVVCDHGYGLRGCAHAVYHKEESDHGAHTLALLHAHNLQETALFLNLLSVVHLFLSLL